jgi:glucose/mannose-6-phosphate isomerase
MVDKPANGPTEGQARMRGWILGLAGQIRDALEQAERTHWPSGIELPASVLLGGMGGSAMACMVARSILQDRLPVPCMVVRDPSVPAWVGPGSMAGVVSYSGDTWEALRMLRGCRARGARTFVVASGGRLLSEARIGASGQGPVAAFPVPSGIAPRAAIGWMLIPVLAALGSDAPGRISGWLREELEEAIVLLEEEAALWRDGRALPDRDPQVLARAARGRFTVAYAPSDRFRPLGIRWKNQILENGKQMAGEAAFPELAHNEIMGWDWAAAENRFLFLMVEDEEELTGARGAVQRAAGAELTRSGAQVLSIPGRGRGLAARLLTHMMLADMTSYELAVLRGLDPCPVEAIQRVKSACGKELLE